MGVIDYHRALTLLLAFYLLLQGLIGLMTDLDPTPVYVFGLVVLVPLLIHSMIHQYREMGGFRTGPSN